MSVTQSNSNLLLSIIAFLTREHLLGQDCNSHNAGVGQHCKAAIAQLLRAWDFASNFGDAGYSTVSATKILPPLNVLTKNHGLRKVKLWKLVTCWFSSFHSHTLSLQDKPSDGWIRSTELLHDIAHSYCVIYSCHVCTQCLMATTRWLQKPRMTSSETLLFLCWIYTLDAVCVTACILEKSFTCISYWPLASAG